MSSRYYPLHYARTRSFTRLLYPGNALARAPGPRQAERQVCEQLLPWLTAQGWRQDNLAAFSQEVQGALAWWDWALNNKAVLHVGPALTQAFLQSDLGDLRLVDVLPREHFSWYVHFEGVVGLQVAAQAPFEGAYVIGHPEDSLRVVLCARLPEPTSADARWLERYDLRIPAKYFALVADEALDYALSDDLNDLERAKDQLRQVGACERIADAQRLTERMRTGHPVYRQALGLLLNALAYRQVYAEDARFAWPPEAPPRLVAALDGAPRERARAQSKLWSLGHVRVEYLGENFSRAIDRTGSVRAHWRRGHWRQQPYGPALTLRKLIWIAPMRVGVEEHVSE